MSIYVERREEIERYEFQYGPIRGKLAMTLDLLTDALTMTGQHGVYCTSARNPAKPAMDLQLVLKEIADAKELVRDAMQLAAVKNSTTQPGMDSEPSPDQSS